MKSVNEYCQILGVDSNATPEQLRRAYRNLVKEWHPDRYLHNPHLQKKAEEKLREINEAYDQLQSFFSNTKDGPSPTSGETRAQHTAGSHEASEAKPKSSAATSTSSTHPRSVSWRKHALWLRRAIWEMARDPWIITVLIVMFALAIFFDFFYRPD